MAWPLLASAQTPVVRSITDEAFQQWLREDNQLIEGILQSLTHIDALVTDIQRMLVQLPDAGQVPPPTPVAAPPAPVVIEKTVIQEVAVPGPLGGWMPQLAGGALLALLAFWLGRRQAPAQVAKKLSIEEVAPQPAVATPKPVAPPQEKLASPPPVATPQPVTAAPEAAETLGYTTPAIQPAATRAPVDQASIEQSDQALELAEIMLSMGLGHGATQTLVEQIRSEPKQALRHWLKLLDIYRKNGQQEEFERSSEELRQHFNVRTEDWHAQTGTKQSLEDFPHIARRLVELWGKADCLVYMRNLLDDNRGGARSGFPQSVAEELLLLTAVLRDVCGLTPS
jgi:pilus assembly protein FimV